MQQITIKQVPGHPLYEVSDNGMVFSNRSGTRLQMKGVKSVNGYQNFTIDKRTYGVHQLVAMAFLNHVPCGLKIVVDHIDENKQNNHVSNLRLFSNRTNVHNKRTNRSSMFKGVYFHFYNSKYVAQICLNGKSKYLGAFECHIKAHLEYLKAYKIVEGIE